MVKKPLYRHQEQLRKLNENEITWRLQQAFTPWPGPAGVSDAEKGTFTADLSA